MKRSFQRCIGRYKQPQKIRRSHMENDLDNLALVLKLTHPIERGNCIQSNLPDSRCCLRRWPALPVRWDSGWGARVHCLSAILYITCYRYMLHVTCYILHVTWYMLHVSWYMLHVTSYMLQVTCCMLHVICYLVHATCYKLPTSDQGCVDLILNLEGSSITWVRFDKNA